MTSRALTARWPGLTTRDSKNAAAKNQLRKALRKQLGYLRRNLKSIKRLEKYYHESPLSITQSLRLKTIEELYHQQQYVFDHETHRVENRMVPHQASRASS